MAWGFAREENIPFLLIHLIFAPFEFHTIASWRLEKLIVFMIFGGRSLPICLVFGFLTMSLQRCFVTLLWCSYTITLMESSRSVTEIPVVNLQCISIAFLIITYSQPIFLCKFLKISFSYVVICLRSHKNGVFIHVMKYCYLCLCSYCNCMATFVEYNFGSLHVQS